LKTSQKSKVFGGMTSRSLSRRGAGSTARRSEATPTIFQWPATSPSTTTTTCHPTPCTSATWSAASGTKNQRSFESVYWVIFIENFNG